MSDLNSFCSNKEYARCVCIVYLSDGFSRPTSKLRKNKMKHLLSEI